MSRDPLSLLPKLLLTRTYYRQEFARNLPDVQDKLNNKLAVVRDQLVSQYRFFFRFRFRFFLVRHVARVPSSDTFYLTDV